MTGYGFRTTKLLLSANGNNQERKSSLYLVRVTIGENTVEGSAQSVKKETEATETSGPQNEISIARIFSLAKLAPKELRIVLKGKIKGFYTNSLLVSG